MSSFREQVKIFWKAFFQEEKELRTLLDDAQKHSDEIIKRVKRLLDLCMQDALFEIGKNNCGRYELILTPNGDALTILYLRYIIKHAPKTLLKVWDFYYAKPREHEQDLTLIIKDYELHLRDVIVYPTVVEQRFMLEVYSDVFQTMSERDQLDVLFLCLDSVVGELYTMKYIGDLRILKEKRNGGITLDLLPSYMDEMMEKEDWTNRHHPLQIYSNYTQSDQLMLPNKEQYYLRGDVYSGISTQMNLIQEMLSFQNSHVNIARANGIQVGFLFYEHTQIPKEQLFSVREAIDEQIIERCKKKQVAENIGAANGLYYTYLDYVVYDWTLFLEIILPIMEDVNTQLYGFQEMIIGESPLYLVDNRPRGES